MTACALRVWDGAYKFHAVIRRVAQLRRDEGVMGEKENNHKPKKGKRWEQMRELDLQLPDAEPDPTPELVEEQTDKHTAETVSVDYPLLRILLRDSGYAFRVKYWQRETAGLLGTTPRTLRDWASKELIPHHREPGGKPYFSPQDIEDILAASARNGKEGR